MKIVCLSCRAKRRVYINCMNRIRTVPFTPIQDIQGSQTTTQIIKQMEILLSRAIMWSMMEIYSPHSLCLVTQLSFISEETGTLRLSGLHVAPWSAIKQCYGQCVVTYDSHYDYWVFLNNKFTLLCYIHSGKLNTFPNTRQPTPFLQPDNGTAHSVF